MNYMDHEEYRSTGDLDGEAAWEAPEAGNQAADTPADGSERSDTELAPEVPESATPSSDDAEAEAVNSASSPEPEKPKRKRTSRKKVAEVSEVQAAGETHPDGETTPETQITPEETLDDFNSGQDPFAEDAEAADTSQDVETSAFVLDETKTPPPPDAPAEELDRESPEDSDAGDSSEANVHTEEPETSSGQTARPRRARRTSAAAGNSSSRESFSQRPLSGKPTLLSLDLNKLDQNLTEEEREEWNAIYASYRSKSLLTGRIVGIDSHSFNIRSRETGRTERRRMLCAVIISHRVKVLIPETEVWMPGQERPPYVLRNMSGAEIDYVILDMDREGGVAIGSRRIATLARQHFFDTAKNGHEIGEKLTCRVLAVGPKRCLVECGGRDLNLSQRDLTYTATPDLRVKYHSGQTLDCILKEYDRQAGQLWVSVKETMPNPFFGAVKRHPIGSRRQAVISGKYGGGVFCTLPDDTVCLCLYSTRHSDSDFHVGDTVILAIRQIDYERNLIYGRILSKW